MCVCVCVCVCVCQNYYLFYISKISTLLSLNICIFRYGASYEISLSKTKSLPFSRRAKGAHS